MTDDDAPLTPLPGPADGAAAEGAAAERETAGDGPAAEGPAAADAADAARRPLVERLGMAAIAAVLATLFGGVAAVSFVSGEPFLAVMAAIGALMVVWVGLLTLVRG